MTEQNMTKDEEFQRFIEGIHEGDVIWINIDSDCFNCNHIPCDPSRSPMERVYCVHATHPDEMQYAHLFNGMMRFFVGGALRLRGLALTSFKPRPLDEKRANGRSKKMICCGFGNGKVMSQNTKSTGEYLIGLMGLNTRSSNLSPKTLPHHPPEPPSKLSLTVKMHFQKGNRT